MGDYKYAAKTLEGIKHFKVANCKEFSELAFLIAKANGFENCYCACLYEKTPHTKSGVKDFGHSVMLIFPKQPKILEFMNKYYTDAIKTENMIKPDKKTIVIDPLIGIADYWDNAIKKYQNSYYFNIRDTKNLRVAVREPLIEKKWHLFRLKIEYPILNFLEKTQKMRHRFKFKEENKVIKNFFLNA